MACTGIPRPQADNAVRMTRFANECLVKMSQMQQGRLVAACGEGTKELSLRVGIHSGPVTGGVLRASKARFQLFGDSVNTAARMESNGIPGKIQASGETAELLRKAGKADWVTAREGTIEAKGKNTWS